MRRCLHGAVVRTVTHHDTMALSVPSALISSRLDQLNSILYGTSLKHIARLQRIQHAAARVVMNQHSRMSQLSSSELLKQTTPLAGKPLSNGVYGLNLPPWPSKLCALVTRHIFLTSCNTANREVSALIQFSLSFSSPSQSKIWMSCFSIFRTESLAFITH